MKDFAKSIRTMNSNKEEIIKKKKEAGATLKVDNGQKLEFSDGTTYVKTSFSDDYREAHNHVGNKATVLKDGDVWVVLYANETKSKEFDTEAEARAFAASVGNKKVGNEYKPDIRITPADLSRNLKQAKNISEIDDIDDEIEYDLREYENAIDECKLKIKDYERSISALRMIQRDVSDARRNLK